MLIKEYRIALPMSVEEYRIAQLYMIQRKSREESSGSGSGVEILINEPYTEGPGGNGGQYTQKIYHIGSHLPGWFRAILPKSALIVEEQAWNAYPYTKTIYRCPFIEKFSLEIETVYKNDNGEQDNVFGLSKSECRNRVVDYLDIVRDAITAGEYHPEEDPTVFVSEKTGRGPLSDNWREEYGRICSNHATRGDHRVMCAYKLCKVEFRYWGMQSKIERFIHDVGLRKTMVRAHRQAWCWQDEYHGLTIEDIRELERQTQEALKEKMAASAAAEEGEDGESEDHSPKKEMVSLPSQDSSLQDTFMDASTEAEVVVGSKRQASASSLASGRRQSWGSSRSKPSGSASKLADWRVESIEQLASSSDEEEFYDAHDDVEGLYASNPQMFRSNSMEMLTEEEMENLPPPSSLPQDVSGGGGHSPLTRRMEQYQQRYLAPSSSLDLAPNPQTMSSAPVAPPGPSPALPAGSMAGTNCTTTILLIVMHGGSIMDTGAEQSKHSDLSTFKATMRSTIEAHYPTIQGHVAFRLVPCAAICSEALSVLASLSPLSLDAQTPSLETNIVTNENFPMGAISVLAAASPEYCDAVINVIAKANATYNDFLRSDEGLGFNGQICLVGDSVGSIIGYDALIKNNPYLCSRGNSRYGSNDALNEQEPSDNDTDTARSGNRGGNLETIKQVSLSNPDLTGSATPGSTDAKHTNSNDSKTAQNRTKETNKDSSKPPPTINGIPETSSRHHHQRPPPLRHASCPASRRTSTGSQSEMGKFEFEVTDFFAFGSPLALVLAYRKLCVNDEKANSSPSSGVPQPACTQLYNLFYTSDPCAVRIEPLVMPRFRHVAPCKVPRYQKFPLGDGQSVHVVEALQSNAAILMPDQSSVAAAAAGASCPGSSHSTDMQPSFERRQSNMSISSQASGHNDLTAAAIAQVTSRWWGTKRVDYALYCPDALQNFPTNALPYLLHASFWESTDVASFILRQVVRQDYMTATPEGGRDAVLFKPTQPREKWQRRRTTIKLRNVAPNHRANDVIVQEDKPQVLSARFMYGPLDMVSLTGEKVDVHIMTQPPNVEWTYFGTAVTDSNGRVTFTVPQESQLPQGMYPVKMIVRGDHTCVDLYLTVLPPRAETVVFSIDGSFTASVSIMGKDPKVRPGAVDVVRHWQDLGYLIIYISARPDMQQKKVVAWLAQHNFPHGMVVFMDGLSADPLRQKANYLKALTQEGDIHLVGAYGSSKDVQVYQSVGMKPEDIYIVGKVSRKQHKDAVVLSNGYAAHLQDLTGPGGSRQAQGNARLFLRKSCFCLPGQNKASSKKPIRKTLSLPQRSSYRGTSPGGLVAPTAGADVPLQQCQNTPAIAISDSGNTVLDPGGGGGAVGTVRTRPGVSPRLRGKTRTEALQSDV